MRIGRVKRKYSLVSQKAYQRAANSEEAANSDWDQETAELLVGDPGVQGTIPAKVVSDLRWG